MNDTLPISAHYPTPPSLAAVRARLLYAPATVDVLAEDLDCLSDQVAVVLTGFDCFRPVPGQWGTEWIVLDPPAGGRVMSLEHRVAVLAGAVLFLILVFLVGLVIGDRR